MNALDWLSKDENKVFKSAFEGFGILTKVCEQMDAFARHKLMKMVEVEEYEVLDSSEILLDHGYTAMIDGREEYVLVTRLSPTLEKALCVDFGWVEFDKFIKK